MNTARFVVGALLIQCALVPAQEAPAGTSSVFEREMQQGRALAAEGRLEEAVRQFERVAEEFPGEVSPLANVGILFARLGRPEEGIPSLEKAAALEPANAALLADLGRCLYVAGYFQRARDVLRRSVDADPDDYRTRLLLGEVLARLGEMDTALREYAAIPESEELYLQAARQSVHLYIRMGRPAEALELATFVVDKFPDLPDGYAARGAAEKAVAESSQQLPGPGLADLEKALSMGSRDPDTIITAVEIAYESGNMEQAREWLSLWRAETEHAGYLLWRGKVRILDGDPEGGIADLSRAVELDPANQDAIYSLARALIRSGRIEEGQEWMRRYERVWSAQSVIQSLQAQAVKAGHLHDLYLAVGRYFAEKGDRDRAFLAYSVALDLAPQDRDVVRECLSAMLAQGRWQDAGNLAYRKLEDGSGDPQLLRDILGSASEAALRAAECASDATESETFRALAETWTKRHDGGQ